MTGPCSLWPLAEGCGSVPSDPQQWDVYHKQAVETASEVLWRLTAGRFGLCPERLRPCRTTCVSDGVPYVADGRWFNPGCGVCGADDTCGCGPASTFRLPGPVHEDTEHPLSVVVDGQPVDGWVLYEPDRLVRIDGGRWPSCQDLTQPADQPGTWIISYTRGVPVPAGGRRAAALLASELHKACTGDRTCKLPSRVRDVTREGVSYTFVDPQEFLDASRTGLTEVDLWLRAVNPRAQTSPSTVWSPDMRRGRVS